MDMSEDEIDYSVCCFNNEKCGPCQKPKKVGVVKACSLDNVTNVTEYLKKVHLLNSYTEQTLSELDIIQNRAKLDIQDTDWICSYHRFYYGLSYRPPKKCAHPNHPDNKRKYTLVSIPLDMCHRHSFVIGSLICKGHLNELYAPKPFTDNSEDFLLPLEVSAESVADAIQHSQDMSDCLNVSPVKFMVTQSKTEHLAPRTKQYLKRKYHEAKRELKKKFCEAYSPGQNMDFLSSEDSDSDFEHKEELLSLLDIYQKSDSFGQNIILSILDPKLFSMQDLIKTFGCSKYQIKKARKLNYNDNGIFAESSEPIHRLKIDLKKCEHFLDYLFSNGLLQDVAYGVTKLKYTTGVQQTLPHCILTACRTHVIHSYVDQCSALQYEPASISTLWRILNGIKPSQRTALAGLDNHTADALNSFQVLEKLVHELKGHKSVLEQLDSSKRYLKIGYPLNCEISSIVETHCISYSLSDQKNKKFSDCICQDAHTHACMDCRKVDEIFTTIEDLISQNSDDKDEMLYDLANAKSSIFKWKQHIIRNLAQCKAKMDCMNKLTDESAYWIRDFAQKVLPMSFREAQRNYFGKKGMSLHIDVFIGKEGEQLTKRTYFTIVFTCNQNENDVLNIADHVLKQFHKDCPAVTNISLKSDNASCYHSNLAILATPDICSRNGIILDRVDFSEPQKGKDQCDRESATARNLMHTYVDSGNNILDAEDLFKALSYSGGIKNAKASIVEISNEPTHITYDEIPNVSTFHSIEYADKTIRVWRYYGIGEGMELKPRYDFSNYKSSLTVLKQFTKLSSDVTSNVRTASNRPDRKLCSMYFCNVLNCTANFENKEDLENHLIQENHNFMKAKSMIDVSKMMFTEKLIGTKSVQKMASSTTSNTVTKSVDTCTVEQGWALPQRKSFRYSKKQRDFLYQIYQNGVQTGQKKTPQQVVDMMRTTTIDNKKMFAPDEYITVSQVTSLFSRWAAKGLYKSPEYQNEAISKTIEELISNEIVECDVHEKVEVDINELVNQETLPTSTSTNEQILSNGTETTTILFQQSILTEIQQRKLMEDSLNEFATFLDSKSMRLGIHTPADGNCFFWAIGFQLKESQKELRKKLIVALNGMPEDEKARIQPYLEKPFLEYVKTMELDGTYADHVAIDALSNVLKKSIRIIQKSGDFEIGTWEDEIAIGYLPEINHYVSVDRSIEIQAFYAVDYVSKFFIGCILKRGSQNGFWTMKFLRQHQRYGKYYFAWPKTEDLDEVHNSCIFFGPITLHACEPFSIAEIDTIITCFKNIKEQ